MRVRGAALGFGVMLALALWTGRAVMIHGGTPPHASGGRERTVGAPLGAQAAPVPWGGASILGCGVVFAAEAEPSPADAAMASAAALERAGDHRGAANAYREAIAVGAGCPAQRALARIVHERRIGSIDEVQTLLDAVIEAGCAESEDFVRRAQLATLMEGGGAKAASLFERAWRTDPSNEEAAKRYGGYLEQAGRFEDAAGVYKDYLRLRPGAAPFYYFVAGTYARQKRCVEAEQWFRAFLHYADELPDIARTTRRDDAFQPCQEALARLLTGVEKAEELRKEAYGKRRAGAPVEVVVGLLGRAIERAPDFAILFRETAEDYQAAGDFERALYVNEAFLRLAPWSPLAADARQANDQMRRLLASGAR